AVGRRRQRPDGGWRCCDPRRARPFQARFRVHGSPGLDSGRGSRGLRMNAPPPYPRMPHLVPGRGTRDDRVLGDADCKLILSRPVLVEEKLDGANVAVWLEGGRVECALRSGLGGQDRARQLGPLRAWLAPRNDELVELLVENAMYAEWLYLTHTIRYDRLPAYFVGLDLWSPTGGFLHPGDPDERL